MDFLSFVPILGPILSGIFGMVGQNQENAREDQLGGQRAANLMGLADLIKGFQFDERLSGFAPSDRYRGLSGPGFDEASYDQGSLKNTANRELTAASGALDAMLAAQGLSSSGYGNMQRAGVVSDVVSNLSRDIAQNEFNITQAKNANRQQAYSNQFDLANALAAADQQEFSNLFNLNQAQLQQILSLLPLITDPDSAYGNFGFGPGGP